MNQASSQHRAQRHAALCHQIPLLGVRSTIYSNFYGSKYNGLQTTLTARNYHGLEFVAGYTYAHALDDMS